MREKETPANAATSAGAGKELTAGKASNSCLHYSPVPRGCQGIAALLGAGAKNGVKLKQLVQMTGKDERVVRRIIQQERKNGNLILADNKNGYFSPASIDELRRFVKSMRHRCAEIAAVTRTAEDALAAAEGQTTIQGW